MTEQHKEQRSIQVWPSGRMFTFRGCHSSPDRMEVKQGDDWRPPTWEEFSEIHNSALAEIYAERDVLTCQSALVDSLLKEETVDGFSWEDVENVYPPESEDDDFVVWYAGCNMPGYMPDEPPHPYASEDDAKAGLLESLENAYEADLAEEEEGQDNSTHRYSTYIEAKEAINSGETAYFMGYAYFISRDVATREFLESVDCDSSEYEPSEGAEYFETPRDIYEWWLVSSWLADQLADMGEPVIRNGFGYWWGRTCTGQALLMDGTLQEVAAQFLPECVKGE